MFFDARDFLTTQFAFSDQAFGPLQSAKGVLAHIAKELNEIEQDPNDQVEWIDVVLLSTDGARRAGHSLDDILSQWPQGPLLDWEAVLQRQFEQAELIYGLQADPLDVVPLVRQCVAHLESHPDDLATWTALTSLAFEGGRRAGGSPAGLLAVLLAKFERNRNRTWRDWRTTQADSAIEHDRQTEG